MITSIFFRYFLTLGPVGKKGWRSIDKYWLSECWCVNMPWTYWRIYHLLELWPLQWRLRVLLLQHFFKASVDILRVDETKLSLSFLDSQFKIEDYQYPPLRMDSSSKDERKIIYITESLIVKRIKNIETKNAKTIFLEIPISKKKKDVSFLHTTHHVTIKLIFLISCLQLSV